MHIERRTIRAVVFDLDDTLYPEREYVLSGYQAVSEHLQDRLGTRKPFDHWMAERFFSGKSAGAFDALNCYFHLELSKEQVLELVEVYRKHLPQIRPYDEVPHMLERLHEHYMLGLLSDGYLDAQRRKFEALCIERHFDAILFTDELGRGAWKPSLTGFEHIRRRLNVPHECCAYVGDNPTKDFVAPNKLDWLTIQYVRPDQVYATKPPPGGEPQVVVRDVAQLHAALEGTESAIH